MSSTLGAAPALSEAAERYQRQRDGLPAPKDPRLNWFQVKLRSWWFWVVIVALIGYALGFWQQYRIFLASLTQEIAETTEEMGNPTELTPSQFDEAWWLCARLAAPTLLILAVIFLLIDRLRPTTPTMKLMALGWGACISTLISLYVNTWAAGLIKVEGPVDPTSSARSAIFIAPFVEEAAKASILFLVAIAIRNRFCTVLQGIPLAGLSAAGFAFTENIIYYIRVYIYASKIVGVDPYDYTMQLVWTRGLKLAFGHPLFTTFTVIGIVVAVRAKSKVVRITAPLAGYIVAATGHMVFNGFASTAEDAVTILLMLGAMVLIPGVFWLWRKYTAERAQIAWRLDDYVRMGWLREADPAIFDKVKYRAKLSFAALLRGWKVFKATVTLIASITELAYLRAYETGGLVDEAGALREKELLLDIRALRGLALDDPRGLKVKPETWKRPRPIARAKAAWANWLAARHPAPAPVPAGLPVYTPQPAMR